MCWYCHTLGINQFAPAHETDQCANQQQNRMLYGVETAPTYQAIQQQKTYVSHLSLRSATAPPPQQIPQRQPDNRSPIEVRETHLHLCVSNRFCVPTYIEPPARVFFAGNGPMFQPRVPLRIGPGVGPLVVETPFAKIIYH